MTISIRAPATLLDLDGATPLAEGIAVIWADRQGWGGIFEPQSGAEALREAAARQPVVARLRIHDGRLATVTLSPSEFVADALRPLTFSGVGGIDTMSYGSVSSTVH